jgi:hypothetical protein
VLPGRRPAKGRNDVTPLNVDGEESRGASIRAFEGVSRYRDQSDAQSLHEAIQRAAEEAARNLKPGAPTEIFEISRIQVEVGNPNVKVYRVVLTPAD